MASKDFKALFGGPATGAAPAAATAASAPAVAATSAATAAPPAGADASGAPQGQAARFRVRVKARADSGAEPPSPTPTQTATPAAATATATQTATPAAQATSVGAQQPVAGSVPLRIRTERGASTVAGTPAAAAAAAAVAAVQETPATQQNEGTAPAATSTQPTTAPASAPASGASQAPAVAAQPAASAPVQVPTPRAAVVLRQVGSTASVPLEQPITPASTQAGGATTAGGAGAATTSNGTAVHAKIQPRVRRVSQGSAQADAAGGQAQQQAASGTSTPDITPPGSPSVGSTQPGAAHTGGIQVRRRSVHQNQQKEGEHQSNLSGSPPISSSPPVHVEEKKPLGGLDFLKNLTSAESLYVKEQARKARQSAPDTGIQGIGAGSLGLGAAVGANSKEGSPALQAMDVPQALFISDTLLLSGSVSKVNTSMQAEEIQEWWGAARLPAQASSTGTSDEASTSSETTAQPEDPAQLWSFDHYAKNPLYDKATASDQPPKLEVSEDDIARLNEAARIVREEHSGNYANYRIFIAIETRLKKIGWSPATAQQLALAEKRDKRSRTKSTIFMGAAGRKSSRYGRPGASASAQGILGGLPEAGTSTFDDIDDTEDRSEMDKAGRGYSIAKCSRSWKTQLKVLDPSVAVVASPRLSDASSSSPAAHHGPTAASTPQRAAHFRCDYVRVPYEADWMRIHAAAGFQQAHYLQRSVAAQ